MSMSSLPSVVATAIILTATGCPVPTPTVAMMKCDLTPHIGADFCPDAACGNNSPVTNVFPYNGLHPDGCANAEGAALVSRSLVGNYSVCNHGGPKTLDLDVAPAGPDPEESGYELVARDHNNRNIVCTGTQLVGATFEVTSRTGKRALRISQMGTAPVAGRGPMKRTVYLITPVSQPANSLCASLPPEAAKNVSTPFLSSGYGRGDQSEDLSGENFSSYAVIIPGALYDYHAELIAGSVGSTRPQAAADGHRWFNIACVGDGLAQTELSGLETAPIVDEATARARLPALHMFTAKYCGGVSATSRGTPIAWRRDDVTSFRNRADGDPIEARWGSSGAECVSHSRLWLSNKIISLPYDLLKSDAFKPADMKFTLDNPMSEAEFLNRLCGPAMPPCKDNDTSGKLVSFAVNHVDTGTIRQDVKRKLTAYSSH